LAVGLLAQIGQFDLLGGGETQSLDALEDIDDVARLKLANL
jgi:hypothetical protein